MSRSTLSPLAPNSLSLSPSNADLLPNAAFTTNTFYLALEQLKPLTWYTLLERAASPLADTDQSRRRPHVVVIVADRCLPVDWLCSANIGLSIGPLQDCSSAMASTSPAAVSWIIISSPPHRWPSSPSSSSDKFFWRTLLSSADQHHRHHHLPAGSRTTAWWTDGFQGGWLQGWTTASKSRMATPTLQQQHQQWTSKMATWMDDNTSRGWQHRRGSSSGLR
ncbi:hypothetical protein TYRP_009223 [Tyrophagus putrescentiae]|nr:hypothetical protein TYRP_009223 [Tyrophagus putrescentiae]